MLLRMRLTGCIWSRCLDEVQNRDKNPLRRPVRLPRPCGFRPMICGRFRAENFTKNKSTIGVIPKSIGLVWEGHWRNERGRGRRRVERRGTARSSRSERESFGRSSSRVRMIDNARYKFIAGG